MFYVNKKVYDILSNELTIFRYQVDDIPALDRYFNRLRNSIIDNKNRTFRVILETEENKVIRSSQTFEPTVFIEKNNLDNIIKRKNVSIESSDSILIL